MKQIEKNNVCMQLLEFEKCLALLITINSSSMVFDRLYVIYEWVTDINYFNNSFVPDHKVSVKRTD